jgi:ubiquitin carboxyl-terminal hydrolase 36/42
LGRKITHPLEYDEDLTLQPYMSSGQFGPSYSLFGVICHAGGGPNSGHYYAFVKSKEGRWYEMNDEMVQPTSLPTGKRNAYMLFYIQGKGQGLEAAVKAPLLNGHTVPIRNGLAAKMKKKIQRDRDDTDEEEDKGVRVDVPLIGPLLPSVEIAMNGITTSQPSSPIDPQAMSLKSKIQAVAQTKARKALESLGNYDSEDGSSDEKERSKSTRDGDKDDRMNVDAKTENEKTKEDDITAPPTRLSSPATAQPTSSLRPIPAAQFYSNSGKNKKRKFSEAKASTPLSARTNGYQQTTNPFSRPNPKRKRMGI